MRKRRNKGYYRSSAFRQSSNRRVTELEPDEFAAFVRCAEKRVLPLIKEMSLDAGGAQFLLAQYTQSLVTDNTPFDLEDAMTIANKVLALWREGHYAPGPEYPYTLEETLQSLQEGPKAKKDYAEWFRSFTPEKVSVPRGLGEVSGGIVKHPETRLWQIWMIVDGPCAYFGAYLDPVVALCGLEELICMSRRGASRSERLALYHKLLSRGDGRPKQIPYDMMVYLIEHLQQYTISL